MNIKVLLPILLLMACSAPSQTQFQIRTVAFYNVENLFDIENDPLTFDDDRTPEGKDTWTKQRYQKKIENIAKVLSEVGLENSNTTPDIIGLCEVENQQVLDDLINSSTMVKDNYGIIHFDSPDERGIDVAFLYKKASFLPHSFVSQRLLLYDDDGYRDYTRDQLIVSGYLDEEEIYFLVNHWPSRSGGEARSKPYRLAAAKLNKKSIDSILKLDSNAKIISMGDFNDDPIDDSFKRVLKINGDKETLNSTLLFNPMEKLFNLGIGSLAYRDSWNLFDQIYFTNNLITDQYASYGFWKVGVFNPDYLVTQDGQFRGYPLRTYAGGTYIGGYSDHFPVYIHLIRKVLP